MQGGALFLASAPRLFAAVDDNARPALRIGLVTDLHSADKAPRGSRHYRDSIAKLGQAAKQFERDKPELVVALGDLIDTAPSLEAEKEQLKRIISELNKLPGRLHFVLGNHCVENLTKPEFLAIAGRERSFYSFDAGGYHLVVLDACFNADNEPYGRKNFNWGDANVPPAELAWLAADLKKTRLKCLVFLHQCLDLEPPHGVRNAEQVRKIFAESRKVLGVIQGHYHPGGYHELDGIPYCTLSAMVEGTAEKNNAYATLDVLAGDAIRINGFHQQKSYHWKPASGA